MYKLCKTEQSACRQRELETGLLSVMEVRQYEQITISDLCSQLGIPRKSFYRYFSSKDGALHALLDHTLLEFEKARGPVAGAKKSGVTFELEQFFHYWHQQKHLLDALERSGLSGMLVERAITQAQEEHLLLGYLQNADSLAEHNHAVSFVICGLMSMVIQWHHLGYTESVQEMARAACMMLTQPLLPNR